MLKKSKLSLTVLAVLVITLVLAVPVFAQSVNLEVNPEDEAKAGETIVLTATAEGVTDPEYRFGYRVPGGDWVPTDPKLDNTHEYEVPLSFSGAVTLGVQVREEGTTDWLDLDTVDYTINKGVDLSVTPEDKSDLGEEVTLEAAAFGFKNPEFRFGRKYDDGSWATTGAMTANTVDYTPTMSGDMEFGVQVREAGGSWEVTEIVSHEVEETLQSALNHLEENTTMTLDAEGGVVTAVIEYPDEISNVLNDYTVDALIEFVKGGVLKEGPGVKRRIY